MTEDSAIPTPPAEDAERASEPVAAEAPASQSAAAAEPHPDSESAAPSGPSASEAWSDVVTALTDLGDSLAAWTRAATDNPENRRHLEEVRAGVNDIAQKTDAALSSMANSEFGQQVKQGATDAGQVIGDTAQKVSDAAAPHVATAFAGLADVFGRAAAKVDEAVARKQEPAAVAGPPQVSPDASPPEADAPVGPPATPAGPSSE